jgi:hypothetical protein
MHPQNAVDTPLYAPAFAGLVASTVWSPPGLSLVTSVHFDVISLTAHPQHTSSVGISLSASVHVARPLGPHGLCDIQSVSLSGHVSGGPSAHQQTVLGGIDAEPVIVAGGNTGVLNTTAMGNLTWTDEGRALSAYVKSLLSAQHMYMALSAVSTVSALTPLGLLTLTDIPLAVEVQVGGFGDLGQHVSVERIFVSGGGVTSGGESYVATQVDAWLVNPTNEACYQLGRLEVGLYVENVQIGTVYTGPPHSQLSLPLGTSFHALNGTLSTPTAAASNALSTLLSGYTGGRTGSVTGRVLSVDARATWVQSALVGHTFTIPVAPLSQPLVHSVRMDTFFVNLNARTTDIAVTAAWSAPFSLDVQPVSASADLTFYNAEGSAVCRTSLPQTSVVGRERVGATRVVGNVTIAAHDIPLVITNDTAFEVFLGTMLTQTTVHLSVRGLVTLTAQVPQLDNTLTLSNVPVSVGLPLPGVNGFQHPPPRFASVDLLGGTARGMILGMVVELFNPSAAAGALGEVTFYISTNDTIIANVTLPELTMQSGWNNYSVVGYYNAPTGKQADVGVEFISTFVSGHPVECVLTGVPGEAGAANPLLRYAMGIVRTPATMPGNTYPLVAQAYIEVDILQFLAHGTVNIEMVMVNPFSASYTVHAWNINVYQPEHGHDKAHILANSAGTADPVWYISGGETFQTPKVTGKVEGLTLEALLKFVDRKEMSLSMDGDMTVGVGPTFTTLMHYSQDAFQAKFSSKAPPPPAPPSPPPPPPSSREHV